MPRIIDAATEPSLLLRLRNPSDEGAWKSFLDVYSPLIYNFCRRRNLQPNDAADVTQEVLLRVSKAIRRFEYDRKLGLFRDWLARIVLNEINRLLAKNSRTAIPTDEQAHLAASTDWNDQFQQHILSSALERCQPNFSSETWNLFQESWIHKKPVAQIAEECKVEASKIYVARSRVLKRLQNEVVRLAEDLPL